MGSSPTPMWISSRRRRNKMTYPSPGMLMSELQRLIVHHGKGEYEPLYVEFGSIIQTLFDETGDDLHELEEVINLKTNLLVFAKHAYYVIARVLFMLRISDVVPHIHHDLIRSIMFINEDYIRILNKRKTESSPRTKASRTSCSINSLGSNIAWDNIIVGLDHDFRVICDKLTEDSRKLDVVSIVGMGGIGKTTLATEVFNDPFVAFRFYVRGWVTVSQTYEKTDLLNQILASIGVEIEPDKRDNYSHLRQKLHQCLMGHRYLVVIDDIWNTDAWDVLKVVFPDNNNGSRLLLTSRDKKVALYAKPHSLVHQLSCLTDEESWELLRKKVFHGNDFPDSLSEPGMQIARNCHGLPLALVVTAGVLAKESVTKDSWERISQRGSLLTIKGNMETLALSLNHLPSHLRNCFLYIGGFPEDHKFGVTRLIWLWIAEGFIQETENQSLEETAKDYLMELVDRNLVIIHNRNFNGAIKTFSVHDVLRELCLEVATKEWFCFVKEPGSNNCIVCHDTKLCYFNNWIIAPHKTSRIFIGHDTKLFYFNEKALRDSNEFHIKNEFYCSWSNLKVLDLIQCPLNDLPEGISFLVNLRYLAIYNSNKDFQSTICRLLSLQFLIIESNSHTFMMLPKTVSNMVNLRHWRCTRAIILPPLQAPMMNLLTISNVVLGDGPKSWVKYFPVVKKFSCFIYTDRKYNFKPLTLLEKLKIWSMKHGRIRIVQKNIIQFPASLKKLTLQGCRLPWYFMSKIQALPNLEVLKLRKDAFIGRIWDAGKKPFQKLTLLKLEALGIQRWEASSFNFPCLQQLYLGECERLKAIPLEMGDIPTLEYIEISCCNSSVSESAYEIQEEQRANGNYDLEIRLDEDEKSSPISLWDRYLEKRSALILNIQKMKEKRGKGNITATSIQHRKNRKGRTSTSLNHLTPLELEELELARKDPPVIPAHHHIHKTRICSDGRFRYRSTKRKILRGGERIKLLQY